MNSPLNTPLLPTPPSPQLPSTPLPLQKKNVTKKKASSKKRMVAFTNIQVFDKKFKADIEACFSTVAKMLFAKKIGVDGSVDTTNTVNLRKYELWSYIYYLFYYNNTSIEEFASMKSKGGLGGASAENFYKTVRDVVDNRYVTALSIETGKPDAVVPFDIQTLAYFLNYIIHKYEDDLSNPIIDYVKEILRSKETLQKLNSIIVKTSPNAKGNVKIVAGDQNAKSADNANVRIRFNAKTSI